MRREATEIRLTHHFLYLSPYHISSSTSRLAAFRRFTFISFYFITHYIKKDIWRVDGIEVSLHAIILPLQINIMYISFSYRSLSGSTLTCSSASSPSHGTVRSRAPQRLQWGDKRGEVRQPQSHIPNRFREFSFSFVLMKDDNFWPAGGNRSLPLPFFFCCCPPFYSPLFFLAFILTENFHSLLLLLLFQDTLLRAVRASKIQHTGIQPSVKPHKWSYASAFLYSITLITTIGKSYSSRFIWFYSVI